MHSSLRAPSSSAITVNPMRHLTAFSTRRHGLTNEVPLTSFPFPGLLRARAILSHTGDAACGNGRHMWHVLLTLGVSVEAASAGTTGSSESACCYPPLCHEDERQITIQAVHDKIT